MLHSSGQASNAMKEVDNSLSKWLHFPQVIICPLKSWWRKWTMQLWCFGELLVVTFSKKKTWDYNFWEKVRETLKTFKIYKTFVLWTITLRFPANNSRRIVRTKNLNVKLKPKTYVSREAFREKIRQNMNLWIYMLNWTSRDYFWQDSENCIPYSPSWDQFESSFCKTRRWSRWKRRITTKKVLIVWRKTSDQESLR